MVLTNTYTCVCKKCQLNSKYKTYVAEGKRTRYVLHNPSLKRIDKYIVDDCLLQSKKEDEKCDYLFDVGEEKLAFLIECKGSDILKAVDQLNSTITILKNEILAYTLKARIISTRVYGPDIRATTYIKLRERLNGNLITKNIFFEEAI